MSINKYWWRNFEGSANTDHASLVGKPVRNICVTDDLAMIYSVCHDDNLLLSSFITFQHVCVESNKTDATSGAGTVSNSGALELTLVCLWGLLLHLLFFMCFVDPWCLLLSYTTYSTTYGFIFFLLIIAVSQWFIGVL